MAQPVDIGMPDGLDVAPNFTIRVTAIDPNTGALVSGVVVNKVVITASQVAGTTADLATGQWFLVPGPNA